MPGPLRSVVVDTGPLVALFDADDAYHQSALDFVHGASATLLSTTAVLTEAMYVLDSSLTAQRNLLAWVAAGGVSLVEVERADLERVSTLMAKYADLPMDFTDGLVVALCERLDVKAVATVDNDFSVYRFKGRGKFVNVFFG